MALRCKDMNKPDKRFDEAPLAEYEAELARAIANDELVSVGNLKSIKKEASKVAENYLTVSESKKVTLRLKNADLIKVKAKAEENNIPYQHLIQALVHQYAEGETKITI